ncbi:MAG: beta-Ala-His dipeptidase [Promethearchaeota archaeon]|nr:MAG: beta-Ala-His dipeptidase [Candidatus Lokiarchaeota archaeon]
MLNLKDLGEPSEFWEYFEKVSKIPRCSEHEEKIRAYIKEESERLGFESRTDATGNLVIRIPAKGGQKSKCVLQCHMDMVCEKNESTIHDFSKDPLKLKIEEINNEKWLTAEGTTLGADNGVGICYILTIMKKIQQGELNFDSLGLDLLFTIDEEQGLRGAFKIENDFIEGNYLINLDSEEDDAVTIGCAGGLVHFIEINKDTESLNLDKKEFIPIKVFISGLMGGHSGVDIHLGRGNAIKIIGELLWKLKNKYSINIISIDGGGDRTNVIPREATTTFYIEEMKESEIFDFINSTFKDIRTIFDGIEPNLNLSIKKLEDYSDTSVLESHLQEKLLDIIYLMPCGPISMHPRIKGLVFTSSNFAAIFTRENNIEIKISQRSLSKYFKYVIWEQTKSLVELCGLEVKIKKDSDYPGWTPNFQSKLLTNCKDTYNEIFNDNIKIKAIHAGLECGILKEKFPKMEMISIGPTNDGAHSPDEKLKVKSVEKVWKLLINLLKKLS